MAECQTFAWAKHDITIYCKHLLETVSSLIRDASGDDEKVIALAIFQENFVNICDDVDDQNSKIMTEAALYKCLQTIAQLVLDLTFVEESSLIDQEFPPKSSFCSVRNIIETLQSVEDLVNRIVPDKSVKITECLYWRKGALLYMYCHTLHGQFSIENMPLQFNQCLKDGIKFLTSMLCTRSSPKWLTDKPLNRMEKDSEPGDEANMLLTQGIHSDTHLLALMYCGEMCYWHTKMKSLTEISGHLKSPKPNIVESDVKSLHCNFCKDCFQVDKSTHADSCDSFCNSESLESKIKEVKINSLSSISDTEFSTAVSRYTTGCGGKLENTIDIVKIGQLCLENYVNAARGPMVIGGWKTTRAEEILKYFCNFKL